MRPAVAPFYATALSSPFVLLIKETVEITLADAILSSTFARALEYMISNLEK